jgi:hypothetical protein
MRGLGRFQLEAILLPLPGHTAMSGDIFGCSSLVSAICIYSVEARNAAKYPPVCTKGLSSLKCQSIVSKLRNPAHVTNEYSGPNNSLVQDHKHLFPTLGCKISYNYGWQLLRCYSQFGYIQGDFTHILNIYWDQQEGGRPQIWPLLPFMKEGPILPHQFSQWGIKTKQSTEPRTVLSTQQPSINSIYSGTRETWF